MRQAQQTHNGVRNTYAVMQVHRGVEYKVPVSAEVEAAFIAADVDGSGFICVSNARAFVSNAAASPCVSVTYVSLPVT